MKLKNYFLLLTMLTFPSLFFGQITLTQSTSNTITPNNSVSCNSDAPNYTTNDNIYYRAFDLNSLGYASGFHVAQVSFGIEEVLNEPVGFAVDVIIYETDSFPGGTLNMVSTVSVPLTSTNTGTIVNIPMSANVNSRYLVYAISVPDQVALGNTTRFFIGSNTLGQSSPSYVSSNNCAITTPTDLSSIGFTNHYVMFLNGYPLATHLNFDGANDSVSLPVNIGNTLSGGTEVTIEYWFKGTNVQSAARIQNTSNWIVAGWNLAGNPQFLVSTDGGTNGVVIANSSSIQDNTWHHVACVWKKNEIFATYLDGVLQNSRVAANVNLPVFSGNNGFLGSLLGSSEFTNGNLDDVRIWNVARTATQINGSKNCELQGNESGLLANYKFNQGIAGEDNTTITSLLDATANAYNGTLVNFAKTGTTSNFLASSPVTTGVIVPAAATVLTPVVYNQGATATALTATVGANGTSLVWYTTATGGTGTTAPTPSTVTVGSTSYWVSSTNANGCESARTEIVVTVIAPATHLNFDGTNDYVIAGNILPSSYTKEAMIFLVSNTGSNNIISGSDSAGQHAFWVPNMRLSAGHNGNWGSVQDAVNLALNTWYHVAVSYDSATQTLRLYKNGVLISTATNIPAPINGNQVLIGSYDNGNLFNGNIDEVRIWNKVLTATDIMNHMNCELQSAETGLVAYYKCNQGNNSADNTTITTLTDASGNANNGTLTNFARTGTTSNFLLGSPIVTGTTCTTLNATNFEVANNIKMYPNPSNGIFTIETQEDSTVEVFDMIGKKILSAKVTIGSSNIDLSNYTNGIYLLTVTNQKGNSNSFKLIKQ